MQKISRKEVIMPGGIELTQAVESYMALSSDSKLLSVACGTGELELYFAEKYGCQVTGIDSEREFIAKAKKKAADRHLQGMARFEIGDGNALNFQSNSFDLVFCCGALCAFFYTGLKEFHRVINTNGKAIIIDVVWRKDTIPQEVDDCWAGESAHVFTVDQNVQAFTNSGFRTIFSKEYHQPAWWDAYYDDMGNANHWQEERKNYHAHQEYIGLGLFVIERNAS